MRTFVPTLSINRRVGKDTCLWWQAIGHSLMSFTEVEQGVIDWAVFFANDKSLWKSRFMDDLKALVPELNRSLKKAGSHRLPEDLRAEVDQVLSEVEALTDLRNDIAHMRLEFSPVPLEETDDAWINTATHVKARKRHGNRIQLVSHDLRWIRSTTRTANTAGQSLHTLMGRAAVALKLIPSS